MKITWLGLFLFGFLIKNIEAQKEGEYYFYTEDEQELQFYLKSSIKKRPLISIPLNQAFLSIGYSKPKVKEVYGFFKFKEKYAARCETPLHHADSDRNIGNSPFRRYDRRYYHGRAGR